METTTELSQRIEALVRPHLRLLNADAPLDHDANLGELGLDSLASIDLLGQIEEEFGIMVPDESLDENTFTSVRSLTGVVSELLAAGG